MVRHRVIHTGERAFACPDCIYTCNVKDNLNKHLHQVHKRTLPRVKHVIEKFDSFQEETSGDGLPDNKVESLEGDGRVAVQQGSTDVQQGSTDIQQGSTDIQQGSTDSDQYIDQVFLTLEPPSSHPVPKVEEISGISLISLQKTNTETVQAASIVAQMVNALPPGSIPQPLEYWSADRGNYSV